MGDHTVLDEDAAEIGREVAARQGEVCVREEVFSRSSAMPPTVSPFSTSISSAFAAFTLVFWQYPSFIVDPWSANPHHSCMQRTVVMLRCRLVHNFRHMQQGDLFRVGMQTQLRSSNPRTHAQVQQARVLIPGITAHAWWWYTYTVLSDVSHQPDRMWLCGSASLDTLTHRCCLMRQAAMNSTVTQSSSQGGASQWGPPHTPQRAHTAAGFLFRSAATPSGYGSPWKAGRLLKGSDESLVRVGHG